MAGIKKLLAAVLLGTGLVSAQAQKPESAEHYPSRTIRFVVPFGAGASSDSIARLVALHLGKALGQTVIVENRPGASGALGTAVALQEPADGYTILVVGSGPMVFNPLTQKKLAYNPADIAPVAILSDYPLVIAANVDSGITSLQDLAQRARQQPGAVTYSFTSTAFQAQMAYLTQQQKVELLPVPYNGGGAAIQAVLAGHTQLIAQDPTSIAPLYKTGRLKALAVTSSRRNHQMPDVPTVAESGFPKFETGIFMGLAVHKDTPAAIQRKLNEQVNLVLRKPEVRERILGFGMEPGGLSLSGTQQKIEREMVFYRQLLEQAAIKVDL